MRRRKFGALLRGAAMAATVHPSLLGAQQPAMPVIGYLGTGAYAPDTLAIFLDPFQEGLRDSGYVVGRNVAIEYRYADGHQDRLPVLAGDLIALKVAVIVAPTGTAAVSARKVTQTVPIVFLSGDDPVRLGLVASYSRPAGNATGANILASELSPKRLELLHQLIPGARSVALLVNPGAAMAAAQLADAQEAARAMGFDLQVLECRTEDDIEQAFKRLATRRPDALLFTPDPLFLGQRGRLVGLAARYAIPAMYDRTEYAAEGGLISFGPAFRDAFRLLGVYAGRILAGAKPADLPVQQPTRFGLTINLRTARMLGIDIPPSILARADEVIE